MSNNESYSSVAGHTHKGGGGGYFPKFLADKRFTVRLSKDKKAAGFEFYDKEADDGKGGKGVSKLSPSTITGPYIGKAMGLQGFKKQGKIWYRSTPFFSKRDEAVVFKTVNGTSEKVFKGTSEDAQKFIAVEVLGPVKKFQILYVAVVTDNGAFVVQINTNLTMAIHDFKRLNVDSFKSNCISVSPVVLDKEEAKKTLDKIAKDALDATLNGKDGEDELGYGKLGVGPLIDQNIEAAFGAKGRTLVSMLKEFVTWRDHVTGGGTSDADDGSTDKGNAVTNVNTNTNPQPNFNATPAPNFENAPEITSNNNNGINDDLPF